MGRVSSRDAPGEQDAQQLGATFIIGTDGKVLLAHYNKFMGDHPEMKKLQAVINEAVGEAIMLMIDDSVNRVKAQ